MNLNYYLLNRKISSYRLAKEAGIPYSTIFDILHHKTDLLDCSVRTIMKIAKVLNIKIEELIKEEEHMDFELFKSTICHNLKRMGYKEFILDVYKQRLITYYYSKEQYLESFYLLAMVDYLSKKNNLPIAKQYDKFRKLSLKEIIYPTSILALYSTNKDNKILEKAKKESIQEFIKYNIVESEIDNVY